VVFPSEVGTFPMADIDGICWFFQMHGYVTIRGLLDDDLLARLTRECDELQRRASAGLLPERHYPRDAVGTTANQVRHVYDLSEAVRTATDSPVLRRIMERLLGPDTWPGYQGGRGVGFQEARPGATSRYSRIGWHADWQGAPSLDIYPKVSFTFHIDETSPCNGFLRVLPGSHQWATPIPEEFIDNAAVPESARRVGGYTETPPPFPMPREFEKIRGEVAVYAEAGDVILHDGFLWHAAARATDDNARRRHVRGSYFTGVFPEPTIANESVKTAAY
jgi:hypothetical protein